MDVVQLWVESLPEPATWERVRENFWYVRLPGTARKWIPIEFDLGPRTLKATSHVIIEPDENHAGVYDFLLRHNFRAPGVAFSIDGREGVIALVARLPVEHVDAAAIDLVVGQIVDATETTFRSILELGFAARLRRR